MNALKELLEHIEDRNVEYVEIIYGDHWEDQELQKPREIRGTLEEVVPHLNFDYDNGYGSQYLNGVIWYADGTWSEREEYDGSEWWTHRFRPEIPQPMADAMLASRQGSGDGVVSPEVFS